MMKKSNVPIYYNKNGMTRGILYPHSITKSPKKEKKRGKAFIFNTVVVQY
jgi:hypothetical protein